MPFAQCRRLIACCMTLAALTPLAACGNIGGGLALEPEHRAVVTADTQLPKRIDKFLVRKPGISGRGLI